MLDRKSQVRCLGNLYTPTQLWNVEVLGSLFGTRKEGWPAQFWCDENLSGKQKSEISLEFLAPTQKFLCD